MTYEMILMRAAARKWLAEHGSFPHELRFGLKSHEFAINWLDEESVALSREELLALVER